ncbi:class I adenylate-forming enzyme family protein [Nanoarchaeota archaeon]
MDNFIELIREVTKKYGDKVFLTSIEDGRTFTYKEFDDTVNQYANYILSLGLKKGDTISVSGWNIPEFLLLFFGGLKTGILVNAIGPLLSGEEVKFSVENSESKFLFIESILIEKLKDVKLKVDVVSIGEKEGYSDIMEEIEKQPKEFDGEVSGEDKALMIYTSGTTGKPKGIILKQKNLIAWLPPATKAWNITDKDVSYNVMPLSHVVGLVIMGLLPYYNGGGIALRRKFSKSNFWNEAEKYKVTYTDVVPTIMTMLLNPPEDIKKYDLSHFRLFVSSSAPLPVPTLIEFEKTFGFFVYECYGLSECVAFSHVLPITPEKQVKGSIGIPIEGLDSAVFDSNDKEVKDGEVGEIVMKGDIVFDGYFKRDEANKEAFANGWFHTGDLAYRDKKGYYFLKGRRKEIIIRGGENLSPLEIDDVVQKYTKVKEVATIGVPDKLYGEEIKSYVVLKEGEKCTEQEIIEFCKKHLAPFKVPRMVEFIDVIPKNPTGKLLRRELLSMHKAKNQ